MKSSSAARTCILQLLVCCLYICSTTAEVYDADMWKQSSLYFVLTDRFNNPDAGTEPCSASNDYCGGTWKGIKDKIPYIKGLNFGSLWVSPHCVNGPQGYHGYWPVDFYKANPFFGTQDDMASLFTALSENSIAGILDVVLNHVGYGTTYPSFQYYMNPFNQESYYHNCSQCPDQQCSAVFLLKNTVTPEDWQQLLKCQLASLPDLDHSVPFVSDQFLAWVQYLKANFKIYGFRYDAASFIDPLFLRKFAQEAQLFGFEEIYLTKSTLGQYDVIQTHLEAGNSLLSTTNSTADGTTGAETYLEAGNSLSRTTNSTENGAEAPLFSTLDFPFAFALRNCFAGEDPTQGCRQISFVRDQYRRIGADQSLMGRFFDNHDIPRFLTLNPDIVALKNAMAVLMLGQGIPILFQGTEQGMGINPAPGFGEREPVWTTGFGTGGELYIYTRMLNWYRSLLQLWETEMTELYVDDTTYIFSRDGRVIVVATNGNGTAPSYALKGLPAATEFCSATTSSDGTSLCVTTADDGSVTIVAAEGAEPLIFIAPSWNRSWRFFTPYTHWDAEWQTGLILTFSILPGAALIGYLLFNFFPKYSFDRIMKRNDADALGIDENEATLRTMRTFKLEAGDTLPPMDLLSHRWQIFEDEETCNSEDEEVCKPLTTYIKQNNLKAIEETRFQQSSSFQMPPMLLSALGTSTSSRSPIALYAAALKSDPNLVWHLTLEYSIPHLGHASDLMFGGLGKVVDMFGEFSTKPIAVCAPMYAPFYTEDGKLKGNALGNTSQFLTTVSITAGSETFLVDVFLAVPDETAPRNIFYFLLGCPEIFGRKTRGTIYSFDTEKDQMQFFSVYNQAVAFSIKSFGVMCVQLHDNHAALSLQYLSPDSRPLVLVVLHNGDYDTRFKLGTSERDSYVYQQLNLPFDAATTRLRIEHLGAVDFLKILATHLKETQCGMGFVAVSPRYALRCYNKFSLFWSLNRQKFNGILNGMDEKERVNAIPEDFEAFFEEKARAKESLQRRVGLEVGRDKFLLVFMGRIAHQKGVDLISLAAPAILRSNPKAQIVVGGPIGDRNGSFAALKLQKVAEKFPGRVWNAAGTYIAGAEKEELILATDFFFSPSRFEPCGLADIEMGWMGAVQIGHNTGGLGKMPGFYFDGGLDNIGDLSARLETVALKALATAPETLKKMAIEAILSTFPPEEMIAKYDVEWSELFAARTKAAAAPILGEKESSFFEEAWLADNAVWKPSSDTAGAEKDSSSSMRAWWSNAMLILAQSFFQAPALLAMLWVEYIIESGTIQTPLHTSSTLNTAVTLLFIKFGINIVSAPIWQWIAAYMAPKNYIFFSAGLNVLSWLCTLWGVLVPNAAFTLYLISCCVAGSPIPIIGLIFLNVEGKVSVSQYGISLMGVSDVFRYLMIFIVYTQRPTGGEWSTPSMIGVRCLFLVLSIWLFMYFVAPGSLPLHFTYYRLKFKGQFEILLKQRKAWIFFTLTCLCDAFALTLTMGCIFEYYEAEESILYWSYNALALSSAVYIGLVCLLLLSKAGIRLGLSLYYGLAVLPGQALIQVLLIIYGNTSAAPIVAASVLNFAVVRYSVVGILNLHTMPSRETTSLVTTLQMVVGSLAVGLGTVAAWQMDKSQAWLWITLAAVVEGVRLLVVVPFIRLHKKECLAGP